MTIEEVFVGLFQCIDCGATAQDSPDNVAHYDTCSRGGGHGALAKYSSYSSSLSSIGSL